MGFDKALLELGGVRLVERAVSIMKALCGNILISGSNPDLEYLGYPLVRDEHRGIGPIAGLHAAMRYCRTARSLVIPCDAPLVTVDVFERLYAKAREGHPPAVVAGTTDGFIEPLIGCYDISALPVIEEQISRKDHKLHNALTRMGAEVEIFRDRRKFLNINTKADIRAIGDIPEIGESDEDKRDVADGAPRRKNNALAARARAG
jgi:molybdopterin-guanine dinucleotide biosynthesis protein A